MKRYWVGLFTFAFLCVSFVWAQTPSEFKGHDGYVHSVAFSNDGTMLATASVDGTAKIWDFATGKEKQILKGHTGNVNTVAFNKDGTIVATGGADKSIRFWNPKDGKLIKDLAKAHTDGVQSIAFSPDGKLLASGSADKSVKLWDVKEGKELKTLGAHKESVYSVAFNAAGTELASCGNDGVIKIWDVKGQKEIKSMMVELPKPVVKVEPKKEEPKKDKDVKKKKDMGKKVEQKELRDAFNAVAFTADGKQVLSGGSDKYLRYWSIADGKETKKIGPTPDWIFGLAVSKDGKNVATAGYGGSLRVYEISSGKELYPGEGVAEKEKNKDRRGWITYSAAFTPDGKAVVTGHEKGGKGIAKVTPIMK
jgi:WD40 repeat protein